jgi:FMN phosphatase YigB (HAD superfamily)
MKRTTQANAGPRGLTELRACLEDAGKRPQVICFDYFDTLVYRNVYPEATKKLAAAQLSVALGQRLSGETLYQLRHELEATLCRENTALGLDPDFNLQHLSDRLFHHLQAITDLPKYIDAPFFLELIAGIEVNIEKHVQLLHEDAVDLLILSKELGLATCLLSDFYLPEIYFRKLLAHHDLVKRLDHVLISADYGVTKGASGRLYLEAIKKTGRPAGSMLMFGDNLHADYDMARHHGLTALHFDIQERKKDFARLALQQQGCSECNDSLAREIEDSLKKTGPRFFPEMGLSLWCFTHRLFWQLIRDKVPAVFFCSKEGEFLRKLFLEYQEQRFGRVVLPAHYLLVSRKATFICSLRPLPEEDFSRLFVHYRDLSLKEFLLSLNFEEKEAIDLCVELGLDGETRYVRLSEQPQFGRLLESENFRQLYEDQRTTQRANLLAYLNHLQNDFALQGMAIVDVGWKGSIQNNLFYALDKHVALHGYYLGLLSPTEVQPGNSKTGILFSDVPEHSPFIHVFNNNRSLFEMLLGASHGSADGYFLRRQMEDSGAERGSSVQFSIPGQKQGEEICVTTLDLPAERELFNKYIRPLQDSYLMLNREVTRHVMFSGQEPPGIDWFARHHARMVFHPSKKEVAFFSGLYHLENFGIFEFTDFEAGKSVTLSQRLRNLRQLLKDPAAVLETGVWPPIILRRLGLDFLQGIDGAKRQRRIFGKKG